MRLKKTAREYLEMLYNEHLDSGLVKHKVLVNQLIELSETYPDLFTMEQYGYYNYSFKMKQPGCLPEFLKGVK